jgi:hypothetical protein
VAAPEFQTVFLQEETINNSLRAIWAHQVSLTPNRSILYKWRNEHPGKAKCRELAQALCNVDMNIDAILSDGLDLMQP